MYEAIFTPTAGFASYVGGLDAIERNYALWVSVGGRTEITNFSDRVSLLLDYNNMDLFVPPVGAFDLMEIKIETNELAEEAVLRECIEETGYSVKVEELVLVKEFIKKIPDVEVFKNGIHQIELIFKCKLDKNKAKQEAKAMDVYQIALEWLPINALKDLRVYPTQNIASYLKKNHSLVKYISLREEGF